jgi:ABC-type lipoprotein export system ATPase subunit
MAGAGVRLEQASKSYQPARTVPPVLDAVDAEIAPGTFVVLVGRSGSGKSTLLNLIGAIHAR